MGPKPTSRDGGNIGKSRRSGEASEPNVGNDAILVEDLLLDEDYDRYLNMYHSTKLVASQFYCNISDIDKLGFGFQNLLEFQKLGGFLNLKDSYDSSQIKAF